MTRTASTAFIDELERQLGARPFLLIEGMFDYDPWRTWTGLGTITWDGKTWLGTGDIISVSAPVESSDGRANGLTLRLNSGRGVDPSKFIASVLATHVQGRPVRIWWGFMTAGGAIVADPMLIYSGFMDQPRIVDAGGVCTIDLACEQELIDQNRAVRFRLTPGRLQETSPGDKGFDHAPGIEDVNVPWPRAGYIP
jgi:hypothetical protein